MARTLDIRHAFVSAKSDGPDGTQLQPSNWNAGHVIGTSLYNPDNPPSSGLFFADEFDDGVVDGAWSWTGTAPTYNETQYPDYMFVSITAAADPGMLVRNFAPGASTAFTFVTKCNFGMYDSASIVGSVGIAILDGSNTKLQEWSYPIGAASGTRWISARYNINGSLTALASVIAPNSPVYLMISRTTGNVYSIRYSYDGIAWQYVGGTTVATTVAKIALLNNTNVGNYHQWFDFVRVFTAVDQFKIGA